MFLFCHCKKGDRLLDLLASADHTWLPMEILMERLGLSRRSVLYLMKKVNASLEAQCIPTIANQRGRGYFLPDESLCMLRTFETKPSAGNPLSEPKTLRLPFRELALQERDDMFRYIVITEPGVSLQAFMNIFHAARNTILQELRHLSSDSCSLHFSVTRHGRIILEDELVQRQWLMEHFETVLSVLERYSTLATPEDIPALLQSYESMMKSRLTDDSRHIMLYFLAWYDHRLAHGHQIDMIPISSIENESPTLVEWAHAFLARHGITSDAETCYLCSIMHMHAFASIEQKDELYGKLHQFARTLRERFESLSGLVLDDDRQELEDRLTVHLLSAYHRLQNGIRYHNPMLAEIEQAYRSLFQLTKITVKSQERSVDVTFTDDEIALIATYFGGAFLQQGETTQKDILVVCSSGIGTSQFLLMQLRARYPELRFTGPLSVSDCRSMSLENAGLILTTTQRRSFENAPCPVLLVSPLPAQHEWDELHRQFATLGFADSQTFHENIQDILNIVSDYARIEDMDGLIRSLNAYMYRKSHHAPAPRTTENGNDLLKYASYLHTCDAMPSPGQPFWECQLRRACEPLLHGHFITQGYVDRIVQLLDTYGDYMVLGKGFLLAHAKSKDGVLASSASVTLFDAPITMQGGKDIRCIICLAPKNQTDHMAFLALLLQHLNNANWCERFFSLQGQDDLENFLWNDDSFV